MRSALVAGAILLALAGRALAGSGWLPALSQAETNLVRGDGVAFVTPSELYATVADADYAIVTAYELPTSGGMTAALERLCRAGRRGDVILAGDRYIVGSQVRSTVDSAAEDLAAAHCSVRRADAPLHLKLAYVAPGVAYLADRNFGRAATIVRLDSPADRDLIAATLRNHPGTNNTLATRKADALSLEARTITDTSGPLFVESESFGDNNPVYDAIVAALAQGRSVSLIVASAELREEGDSARERTALRRLQAAGAQVRAGRSDAKMAVGLNGAWLGSTNATAGYPDQIDWGRTISAPLVRAELARRFLADWAAAQPV